MIIIINELNNSYKACKLQMQRNLSIIICVVTLLDCWLVSGPDLFNHLSSTTQIQAQKFDYGKKPNN